MMIVRLLLWLLIFYLFFRLGRFVWQFLATVRLLNRSVKTSSSGDVKDGHLIKDPQCGTYFLESEAVHAVIDGREYRFCCRECRDAFLQTRRKTR